MAMIPDTSKFRLPFPGSESVERNFSQAGQDLFVLSVLDGRRDGVFLDLGCNHPIKINNTYLLESRFGWKGLSIDIDEDYFRLFVFRKSKILAADCRTLDWNSVVDQLGTRRIDYLSLDLEPPDVTLEALKSIPFDDVEFDVITFEHDAYVSGDKVREASREIFAANGYVRLCSDVKHYSFEFEDWYFNPRRVDAKRCSVLSGDMKEWEQIVFLNN